MGRKKGGANFGGQMKMKEGVCSSFGKFEGLILVVACAFPSPTLYAFQTFVTPLFITVSQKNVNEFTLFTRSQIQFH